MLLQVAVRDIGQLTDLAYVPMALVLAAPGNVVGRPVHDHEPNLHEYENVTHGKAHDELSWRDSP